MSKTTGRIVVTDEHVTSAGFPVVFGGGRLELVDHRVRREAVDFMLRVRGDTAVSARSLQAVYAARPTLAEHTCTLDGDDEELVEFPHLVEHVAIDLLVEQRGGVGVPVAGYTRWLSQREGLARITLSSLDHISTDRAMLAACALVAQYI